jgi:hypothetical protein
MKTPEALAGLLVAAHVLEGTVILEGTPLQEERKLRTEVYGAIAKIKKLKSKNTIIKELEIIETYFKLPPKNPKSDWCKIEGNLEAYCMSHHCFTCPANSLGPYYNPNSKLIKMVETFNAMEQTNSKFKDLANQLAYVDGMLVDYIRSRAK